MPGWTTDKRTWPRSVGVLGAAPMAGSVTRRLLAVAPGTVRVLVFGQLAECTAELVQLGALSAASCADLAARSQVVLALLNGMDEVGESLAGPRGLEAGVQSPTTLVIGAVVESEALLALSARLLVTTAGLLGLVEAVLHGAAREIEHGQFSITVGAEMAAYDAARPVLEALGRCVLVGGLGSVGGVAQVDTDPGRAAAN